jgi:hypothetical protein
MPEPIDYEAMGVLAGIVLEQAKKDGVLPAMRPKTWLEKFADAARSLIGGECEDG